MLVSVIMPTFNCGKFIAQSIESVIAQTVTDWEICIVDDCSTDNTLEVLQPYMEKYPNIRYTRLEKNGGPAVARTEALRMAAGKYVAFLDSDDLWAPDKLEKQVAYLDRYPECQLVFTLVENFFDGAADTMNQRQEQLLHSNVENCLPSCCIRRDVFEKYGVFREDYPYGEDTYWATKLWAAGINMKHCIQERLYIRRIHDSNISLTHRKVEQKDIMTLMADAIREARKGNKR